MKVLRRLDKASIPFFLFYVFVFSAAAFFFTFINVYFYQAGFAISQIGVLTALGPMISLLAQPMWGILSDRTDKRLILIIVLMGAAIMSIVLSLSTAFLFLVFGLILFFGFNSSAIPLGDAITLQFLEGRTLKYSSIRIVGAVSFGLLSAFIGHLLGGNVGRIFYFNSFFLVMTALVVFLMPAQKKQKNDKEDEAKAYISQEKSGIAQLAGLIKNKVILCVYLSSFVYGMSMTFLFNFFGIRMTEIGAHEGQIGTAMFISAFSEIPFLLFADSVFRKRRPEYLLMLSAFFMTIRLFIMFISSSVYIIYFAQSFQGISFMLHLYFSVILLHENSPAHMKSTVQTVHAMIRMGIGALLGGLGGGVLAQHIGIQNVFLILTIFVFVSCFILPGALILTYKIKNKKNTGF